MQLFSKIGFASLLLWIILVPNVVGEKCYEGSIYGSFAVCFRFLLLNMAGFFPWCKLNPLLALGICGT